jgi:hypothetical protein
VEDISFEQALAFKLPNGETIGEYILGDGKVPLSEIITEPWSAELERAMLTVHRELLRRGA